MLLYLCLYIFFLGIVSIVFSLRVDRLYDSKITWTDKFKDTDSQDYQQLEHEAARAVREPFIFPFPVVKIFVATNALRG